MARPPGHRPPTYLELADTLEAVDTALRDFLLTPRLRQSTRTEIQRILNEIILPILRRDGRR